MSKSNRIVQNTAMLYLMNIAKELQSLGLDFKCLDGNMEEIDLRDSFEDDDDDIYEARFRAKANDGADMANMFDDEDELPAAEEEESDEDVAEDLDLGDWSDDEDAEDGDEAASDEE